MARLRIVLPQNWLNVSAENPEGPPTFVQEGGKAAGALQISLQAEYRGGAVPNPTVDELISLAEGFAKRVGEITVRGRSSGTCALGTYGTVLASSADCAWMQVWILSNGRDFVLATHTCESEPTECEVDEASMIVKKTNLT